MAETLGMKRKFSAIVSGILFQLEAGWQDSMGVLAPGFVEN